MWSNFLFPHRLIEFFLGKLNYMSTVWVSALACMHSHTPASAWLCIGLAGPALVWSINIGLCCGKCIYVGAYEAQSWKLCDTEFKIVCIMKFLNRSEHATWFSVFEFCLLNFVGIFFSPSISSSICWFPVHSIHKYIYLFRLNVFRYISFHTLTLGQSAKMQFILMEYHVILGFWIVSPILKILRVCHKMEILVIVYWMCTIVAFTVSPTNHLLNELFDLVCHISCNWWLILCKSQQIFFWLSFGHTVRSVCECVCAWANEIKIIHNHYAI